MGSGARGELVKTWEELVKRGSLLTVAGVYNIDRYLKVGGWTNLHGKTVIRGLQQQNHGRSRSQAGRHAHCYRARDARRRSYPRSDGHFSRTKCDTGQCYNFAEPQAGLRTEPARALCKIFEPQM